MPPIGAQGLNMSLTDIAALLDLCAAARAAGRDIGGAGAARPLPPGAAPGDRWRASLGIDALNRAAMAGAPRPRDLRRAGLTALHGVPPVRRAAMRIGAAATARPRCTNAA